MEAVRLGGPEYGQAVLTKCRIPQPSRTSNLGEWRISWNIATTAIWHENGEDIGRRGRAASMNSWIRKYLAGRSSTQMMALSGILIAAIGAADYLTGYHLSFGLFYVAPVFLLSWYGSRTVGILGASLCAITWLFADSYTAPPEIDSVILAWNTVIRFGFFVIIAFLLASLRAAYARETALARTDALTGLTNSRAFRESAAQELLRARRASYPLTMLYLDLDNFKRLNDRFGHAAGDEMLREFAKALRGAVRATDLVGRIGGDEFVVLLPNTTELQGEVVIAKIRYVLQQSPRFVQHGISASIGAVTAIDPPSTIDDFIASADAIMYEMKRAGEGARAQVLPEALE